MAINANIIPMILFMLHGSFKNINPINDTNEIAMTFIQAYPVDILVLLKILIYAYIKNTLQNIAAYKYNILSSST